jgi:hypothetical protein
VDGDQVDDVTRLPPVRRRLGFVGSQVNRVQHVVEQFILYGGKETGVAIGDPFELHRLAETLDLRLTLAGLDPAPRQGEPRVDEGGAIRFGGRDEAFLGILENIDIPGKTWSRAIQRDPPAT